MRRFPSASRSRTLVSASYRYTIQVAYSAHYTGPLAGDEVVLAFVTRDNTDNGPLKQLFGFQRVHLTPGASLQAPCSLINTFACRPNQGIVLRRLPDYPGRAFRPWAHARCPPWEVQCTFAQHAIRPPLTHGTQIEVGVGEGKLVHPFQVIGEPHYL